MCLLQFSRQSTVRCSHITHITAAFLLLLLSSGAVLADHPSAGIGSGLAGPVNTITPETLPAGRWSVSLRGERNEFDELPDTVLLAAGAQGEEVHSTGSLTTTALSAAYGLSDDLTLAVRLPYVARNGLRGAPEMAGDPVEVLGDSRGVGDASLYGQYRFLHDQGNGRQAAVLFGVKAPTGDTHETTLDGERFEIEHQPGSGSWDPFAGFAAATTIGPVTIGGSVLYTRATEGSLSTSLGDSFFYSVALAHRLGAAGGDHDGHNHGPHTDSGVDLIVELNGEWRDQVEAAGHTEAHTGGNMVYIAPGVRYTSPGGWAAALSAGIPVVENLNGIQSEPAWRVIASIGVAF